MAVSSKIKALIKLKNKANAELAKHLGITNQALSNKFYRDSFSAADLIKVSAFLKCDLAFIVDDAQKIILTEDDIKQAQAAGAGE
jgi:transcriptional regulator with XRE-family HTH domain